MRISSIFFYDGIQLGPIGEYLVNSYEIAGDYLWHKPTVNAALLDVVVVITTFQV